jgi:hypothetical protein
MGTEYRELGSLGRDLAIWEIHLRSTGKSTHTIKSYVQGVRALAGFLSDQGCRSIPRRSPRATCEPSRRTCCCRRSRAERASARARSAPATTR